MEYSNQVPDGNVNVTHKSPVKELLLLMGGAVVIAMGIYFILGLLMDYSVEHLSPSQEQALTLHIDNPLMSKYLKDESRVLQAKVDELQENCMHLPYPIKVHAVNDEMVNAVAFPGGTVLVFKGLWDRVQSENELAFVLGHELGHFKHRDHLKGMGRALVFLVGSILLFGNDNSLNDFIAPSFNVIEMGFSRGQESQADAVALDMLHCHYGHVGGAAEFFEMLSREEGDSDRVGHFLSSHPDNSRRIADLKTLATAKGYSEKATLPRLPLGS